MQRCLGCMREFGEGVGKCPHCGYVVGTDAAAKNHLSPGTVLQGRYTLGRALGQGGFGITYIAWDQKLARAVAIKEYMPNTFASRITGEMEVSCYNEESQRQFSLGLEKTRKETRALSQFGALESVVKVHDCIEENNTAYIIMELLRGRTVKEILQERGKLTFAETMRIMTPVLQTLEAMHGAKMIHRDVSPDNIFVREDGRIKLLDFGAARVVAGADNKTLSVVLKAGYAPIEQYSSKIRQGPYTDVYAASATIYKMLTGETPPDSLSREVDGEDLDLLRTTDAPLSAQKTILHGMAQNAEDRIQSARELLEQLQSDLPENIEGIDPTQFLDAYKKRKTTLLLAVVVAVLAVLIAVLGIVVALRNRKPPVPVDPSTTAARPAQTTAPTSAAESVPAIAVIPETTTAAAPKETADSLRSKIEAETGSEVQDFACQDYNHDGTLEAFALVGEQEPDYDDEMQYTSGSFVFANADGVKKIFDFTEPYASGNEFTLNQTKDLHGYSVYRHSGGSGGLLSLYTVNSQGKALEIATNGTMQSTPKLGKDGWLEIACSAFDANADGTGHTWKTYFFYYDENKNVLTEYGGVELSQSELFRIKNAESCIRTAVRNGSFGEQKAYKIDSAFYRGNGIVNVNLTIDNEESAQSKRHVNLYVKNGTAEIYIADADFYGELGEGVYLKSSSNQNVEFPKFPY